MENDQRPSEEILDLEIDKPANDGLEERIDLSPDREEIVDKPRPHQKGWKSTYRIRDGIKSASQSDHSHHWNIDENKHQLSRGVCRHCGETRVFKNWFEDSDFLTNEERKQDGI